VFGTTVEIRRHEIRMKLHIIASILMCVKAFGWRN